MKKHAAPLILLAASAMLVGIPQVSTAGWDPHKDGREVAASNRALDAFRRDPSLAVYFRNAYGYAVFPAIGKAAFVFGGAYGTGTVWEQERLVGTAKVSQASFGPQIGGESYSEIIFFRDPRALHRFERGEVTPEAGVSAVAGDRGAAIEAGWNDGIAVFTRARGGLLASAAFGGQKFSFRPVG